MSEIVNVRGLQNFDFFVEKYNLVLIGSKWCQEFDKNLVFAKNV